MPMRTRRYDFHCCDGVLLTLVFEPSSSQWYVEKNASREVERLTLAEFEDSPIGRQCGNKLESALHDASNDL